MDSLPKRLLLLILLCVAAPVAVTVAARAETVIAEPANQQTAPAAEATDPSDEPAAGDDAECLDCHEDDGEVMAAKDGPISVFISPQQWAASAHAREDIFCVDCHEGVDLDTHPETDGVSLTRNAYGASKSQICGECHEDIVKGFAADVHRTAAGGAVGCSGCHRPHEPAPSPDARTAVQMTCAGCHEQVSVAYARSVHGQALSARHNPDVPVCTDCHRPHRTLAATSAKAHLDSVALCTKCHSDEKKMAGYGLSTAVTTTYLQDFHGVSVTYDRKLGRLTEVSAKATCIDCHGAHDIASKELPGSLAVKANRAKACARCHEGANESFSEAWLSHHVPSLESAPLVLLVKVSYWIFIPLVLLGLLSHIGMDVAYLLRHGLPPRLPRASGAQCVRFNRWRRAEHLLMMVTFTLLMVTGVPQKFHDSAWAEWIIVSLGGINVARVIHRLAGLVFAAHAAAHLVAAVIGIQRGWMKPSMVPTRRDFTESLASIRYSLGLATRRPLWGRYDFRQKFEYWGMVLGSMVMIVTGFTLYFPTFFARYLPGEFIPAAKTAHSYEAMMALLVIIVWHFYCAHLRPEVFPVDASIFTGKISEARMEEEHPLERS
ncbi:MAG: cytochrome c3 family protein [Candidatus Schekmanbacteria bacterium]|nr:cytochrome c3 family protein [Candidatus Schekmanbacteria bacterium]